MSGGREGATGEGARRRSPGTSREERLILLKKAFLLEAQDDQGELSLLAAASPELTPEQARRARKLAHDLRGSGGSYGFPEVSAAAAAVEDAFVARAGAARLGPLVVTLGGALARALEAMK